MEGWLGAARMTEILNQSSFVCHKDHGRQCAGHMLMKKSENDYVRMSELLRIDLSVTGQELVFDSVADLVEHHRLEREA